VVGSRTTDKLSEERLEKKRAADRHAQRVLREKTKRHIEELEEKVAALSNQNGQEAALKAAKKRTLELENELAELRTLYEQKSTEGTLNVLDQPSLCRHSRSSYAFQWSRLVVNCDTSRHHDSCHDISVFPCL
jgi:hypothetical protein